MKIKVNRNTLWSEIFFRQLKFLGIKNAVVCPGSRSTPLVFGIKKIKGIKIFNLVDERSAAFFALGLSKKTGIPTIIITTSGTAVAELYPAIIEAFNQRLPLIVCTADRPPELQNCGANQTINQKNIFRNHIRYSVDLGTPDIREHSIKKLLTLTKKAVVISTKRDKGPVHINLPFRKPFEPDNFTDELEEKYFEQYCNPNILLSDTESIRTKVISRARIEEIFRAEKSLIYFSKKNPSKKLINLLIRVSKKLNAPIIDDGTSGLRFSSDFENIIANGTAFLRNKEFVSYFDPEIIIQIGDAPVSNSLLDFFANSRAKKYLVDEFGDVKDPSLSYYKLLKISPELLCYKMLCSGDKNSKNRSYLDLFKEADRKCEKIKKEFLSKNDLSFEGSFIPELIEVIENQSSIMISNSSPVRDWDLFAPANNSGLNIFSNRGASGIDGITSTSLGIAYNSKKPAFLITGDLAFYHDLNGLLASKKYSIPLTVILINNNGGGIFDMLPVAEQKMFFEENFKTPTGIEFKKIVEAYGGKFYNISTKQELKEQLKKSISPKTLSVLQIETDSKHSAHLRKKYFKLVAEGITNLIDEN